jgi:uncharacterized protein YndB with AHSA1/START domain
MGDTIIIEQVIPAAVKRVYSALVTPADLMKWHGWSTPYAEVEPQTGGRLKIGYADPEGMVVFDLLGEITVAEPGVRFSYVMPENSLGEEPARTVDYRLFPEGAGTKLRLEFDMERTHNEELQREGWGEHISNLTALLTE